MNMHDLAVSASTAAAQAAVSAWLVHLLVVIFWAIVAAHWIKSVRRGVPWYRDSVGWHVMSFAAIIGVIFTMLELTYWWPHLAALAWYVWAYLGTFAAFAGVGIWRLVIILRGNGRH